MKIFGIVNVTEDSFSDGGKYLAPDAAIEHARRLADDGADVLDLGAASSNPDAKAVSSDLEIARLAPVIAALMRDALTISIDSFSSEVQRWALAQNVAYLNDVRGFSDPRTYPVLAASPAKLVVMHSVQAQGRATQIRVAPEEIFGRCLAFFEQRVTALIHAGVARTRLILDPGMGFFLSSDPAASLEVLRNIPELKRAFDLPVLISVSRKSFLRKLAGCSVAEAGPATLAAEIFAVLQGTDYIRSHEPRPLKDALTIWSALAG